MMASVNSHHGERPHALGHERGPDRPACPERRDEETRTGPEAGLPADLISVSTHFADARQTATGPVFLLFPTATQAFTHIVT